MARFIRQIRDGNHAEIVRFLELHGIEVVETFQPLDCLVHSKSGTGWIEIKTAARNADIKRTQIEFMSRTAMPVAFVKTGDEALAFARTMSGITDKQKENLAAFLREATRKKFHPAVLERVLSWK